MKGIKFFLFVLIVCISSIFNIEHIFGMSGIDFTYWNSNSDRINYWSIKNLPYYAHPYESGLSDAQVNSFTVLGYNNWSSTTGISGSRTTTQSNAKIDVLGFTRTSFTNMGIPSNVLAVAIVPETQFVAYGYYGQYTKSIYKINGKGYFYFVWDNTTQYFTTTQWNRLAVHEMGHIFGYWGHFDTNGVMKTYFVNITTTLPSTDNRNHLQQIY